MDFWTFVLAVIGALALWHIVVLPVLGLVRLAIDDAFPHPRNQRPEPREKRQAGPLAHIITFLAIPVLIGVLHSAAAQDAKGADSQHLLTQGFAARCSEPMGLSLSYGWLRRADGAVLQSPDDGFQQGTDGFSNMNPVFIYRSTEPRTLLSIWGDTRPDDISPEILDEYAQTSVDRNVVIARSDELISAVLRIGKEVWLTTLIPSLEIGYFSYHEVHPGIFGGNSKKPNVIANSSALRAECRFSRPKD